VTKPIRLRKGQHLIGDGEATVIDATHARGPALTLGADEQGRKDPGGAPVGVSGLRFLGGNGSAPVVQVSAEGFSISRLFLSAAGTGIEISGADGILSDIVIDQALRGLVFRGAQNVVVQGLISYLANYAITLEALSSDIVVSQAVLGYSRMASVLFVEGASGIRSVRFANCDFVSNESFPQFIGHVHVRSNPCDAHFAACTFRNHPGFAVRQQAGTGAELSFDGCLFDGSPSRKAYGASSSSGGLLTGADGRLALSGCHFRRLAGPAIAIGPYLSRVVWQGGTLSECRGDPLRFDSDPSGHVTVRSVDSFGRTNADGSFVLPWRGPATAWRITARTTGAPGAVAIADCTVMLQREEQVLMLTPSTSSTLHIAAGFGERPGGQGRTRGHQGLLCLSAERSDVEWSAETLT
jgi:hypothetical protein